MAGPRGRGAVTAAVSDLQDSIKVKDSIISRLEKDLDGVKVELKEAQAVMQGKTAAQIEKSVDFQTKVTNFLEERGWKMEVHAVEKGNKTIKQKKRLGVLKFIGKFVSDRDEAQIKVKVRSPCKRGPTGPQWHN